MVQVRILIQLLRNKTVSYADIEGQLLVKWADKVKLLVEKLILDKREKLLDTLLIVCDTDLREVHIGGACLLRMSFDRRYSDDHNLCSRRPFER